MSLLLLLLGSAPSGTPLGLSYGQMGIGATTYSNVRAFEFPPAVGIRMQHLAPKTTSIPTLELGHAPTSLAGTIKLTAADVDGFIVAVRTGTAERRISFVIGATEAYGFAYSGDLTAIRCINRYGTATREYDVSFLFPLSRPTIYRGADDVVLYGN
jgi:hypothetical protein